MSESVLRVQSADVGDSFKRYLGLKSGHAEIVNLPIVLGTLDIPFPFPLCAYNVMASGATGFKNIMTVPNDEYWDVRAASFTCSGGAGTLSALYVNTPAKYCNTSNLGWASVNQLLVSGLTVNNAAGEVAWIPSTSIMAAPGAVFNVYYATAGAQDTLKLLLNVIRRKW